MIDALRVDRRHAVEADIHGIKGQDARHQKIKTMNDVNDAWWAFAWELVGHYYDGMMINEDGTSTTLGYPTDWLAGL